MLPENWRDHDLHRASDATRGSEPEVTSGSEPEVSHG
jgi:hypothetical protein